MKIKLIGTLAALGLAGTASAAVTLVGVDSAAGANWRTGAANGGATSTEYGTDGYVLYGINAVDNVFIAPFDTSSTNAQSSFNLPTGFNVTAPGTINHWPGNGNFGTMEAIGGGTTTVGLNAGVADGHQYTIGRSADTAFRLTLMLASGDGANVTFTPNVNDGSGAVGSSYAHTADGLAYHTFDVSSGSTDIVVTINGNNNFSLTGVAFDNVIVAPEPSSAALLGLGGLALILRRRK